MRIEILTMLIAGIFLGAFCFSLIVEAVQTLIHIGHQDAMHLPVAVFSLGCGGLVLNLICYVLIGGYTHHQSNFLQISTTGDIVVDQVVSGNGLVRSSHRQSKTKRNECNVVTQSNGSSIQVDVPTAPVPSSSSHHIAQRKHTFRELIRDISSK